MSWINIEDRYSDYEERLPEEYMDVLLYANGAVHFGYLSRLGHFNTYEDHLKNVTHWMPLPEPPKED